MFRLEVSLKGLMNWWFYHFEIRRLSMYSWIFQRKTAYLDYYCLVLGEANSEISEYYSI